MLAAAVKLDRGVDGDRVQDGDEKGDIHEVFARGIARGARDRARAVKLGEFYWQDGGDTRAIKNVGSTRVELVEFELK
jgi:hypothetical protein